jgi:sarcosine oxidase subunit alpha
VSASRVPGLGSAIDRNRPIRFLFDGRPLLGYAGDTLASALLANGVGIVGRSFKLHRPRGIMGAGPEDPNAFVRLVAPHEEPNVQATAVPLVEGLEARSVHAWPSAGFDILAGLQAFARVLPAGFYYKTFIGGGNAWPRFEPLIRRLAGLGPAPEAPDPLPSETRHAHVDVLVVGAGAAGLAAAAEAARGGASVMLVEDAPVLPPDRDAVLQSLGLCPGVTVLRPAAALGIHHDRLVTIHERQPQRPFLRDRLWKVRTRCVVLATGDVEQPLVLAGNDRPGVMLADAALHYLDLFGIAVGQRVAVVTNNARGLATAASLQERGVSVVGVAAVGDLAASGGLQPDVVRNPAAIAIRGGRHVRGLDMRLSDGRRHALACDAVLLSGGFQPAVQLWTQAGGRLQWSEAAQALLPVGEAPGVLICGAAAGTLLPAEAAASGAAAGRHALSMLAGQATLPAERFGGPGTRCAGPVSVPALRANEPAFVDVHNDVTRDDVALAMREGYRAIDHVKRYTTLGMGPDQGRTSARNGARLVAGDGPAAGIRTTTMRPPWRPVPFAAVAGTRAGTLASPWRTTPLTDWAVARGAVLYESGADWRRPGYFPQAGEGLTAAARREALAVRTGVGIYDSSPLGKICVRGPDSARFLDFVYAGRLSTMKPMTARYGLMLREDGRLFDDGVVFREADDRFVLTTTTGNAAAVLSWLEFVKTAHRRDLDVRFLDISEPWTDVCLCGPLARTLLSRLGTDVDLSNEAFPFMAFRMGTVASVPARIKRVSFTGELSYEIWVARRHALAVWEAAFAAGEDLGLTPVGSEANHILRVEKGFLSMGHEVDGFANPFDLGLDRFVALQKDDFIGRQALLRDQADGAPRPELVGLLPQEGGALPEGAPIVDDAALSPGFVTASVDSPTLDRPVALALLDAGRSTLGGSVDVMDGVRRRRCTVTAPVFVDPTGARLRG